jgi:hypothetical protein
MAKNDAKRREETFSYQLNNIAIIGQTCIAELKQVKLKLETS